MRDEAVDRLIPSAYDQTDVFVLCFSLGDRRSLRRVIGNWASELRRVAPDAHWVLVGNWTFGFAKHGGNEEADVSPESVQRAAQLLERKNGRNVEYIGCDAREQENLQAVLDAVSVLNDIELAST